MFSTGSTMSTCNNYKGLLSPWNTPFALNINSKQKTVGVKIPAHHLFASPWRRHEPVAAGGGIAAGVSVVRTPAEEH